MSRAFTVIQAGRVKHCDLRGFSDCSLQSSGKKIRSEPPYLIWKAGGGLPNKSLLLLNEYGTEEFILWAAQTADT